MRAPEPNGRNDIPVRRGGCSGDGAAQQRHEEISSAMSPSVDSTITIPGMTPRYLEPDGSGEKGQGRLRYLTGGSGPALVMLHTVRTQAEHFRHVIRLVQQQYTIYALDLPGMGYSEIVPGASYEEPALRAGVERLITELDLRDVTLLGESIGAVLALTTAADLPDRVRRVVAVNTYDYAGGGARANLLARLIITGIIAPGIGPIFARQEPKPVMRAILKGGLVDRAALREDYLDEVLSVGRRPGYPIVARGIFRNLPSLIAARTRYPEVTAPVHLIYGENDWSRASDRQANKQQLPYAEFTQVANAGHFIALERPDVPADLLNSVA
jgi:pimeloyl-ACP methyl ester carboxylesterase